MMDSGVKKALDRLFAERQRHYWSLDYETTTSKLLELVGELEKAVEKSNENKKEAKRHDKGCIFHDDYLACNCGINF